MDRLIGLVLLRWRLELRALRFARERGLGLLLLAPLLLIFSVVGSLLVFAAVRGLSASDPNAVAPLLSALATLVGLFWALSPLLAGVAFSETHDVSRLLHLPIPSGTLVASSLLANLAQPVVLSELPIILALSLALSRGVAGLPWALAGVCLAFVLILAMAQVSGLLMLGIARNRRFQDLALFLGVGFTFLLSLLPILLISGAGTSALPLLRAVLSRDIFVFSPFAWGVRAAVHGGAGELAGFLGFGLASLLATLAALGLSAVLIQRIHRGELNLAGPRASRGGPARMAFGGALGALFEKDVRMAWRDPALKASLLLGMLGPLLVLVLIAWRAQPGTLLLGLAAYVGVSVFGSNAFGLERRGIGLLLSFPLPRWRILVGKNLGSMLFRLPGVLAVLAAGLLLAPLAYLPAALAIVACAMLVAAGADNYVAILFPVTLPAPGQSPHANVSGGRGLGAAVLSAALFFGVLLLAGPFLLLAWLPLEFERPALWWVTLPLALAGAASVYAMLVAGAEKLLLRREPELLERILGEA